MPTVVAVLTLCFFVCTSVLGQYSQPALKLVGTGAVGAAGQGFSVGLSASGTTAIVGGWNDSSQAGAAWIFSQSGASWVQQGSKLVGTGAAGNANQGWSVALSGDGNTAIVGGSEDNGGVGAVWIFTQSNGTWTQQGSKLVGTNAIGHSAQGWSVALSNDGNTAIVGGGGDNQYTGAVWIFTRSNGTWTQQGSKLVSADAIGGAMQGYSVGLSSDGNTAIIGAIADDGYLGAAWIYTRASGVWSEQGKLVASDAQGAAGQGQSVALSADSNTAIVGGSWDDSGIGAAWVYTRTGTTWSQQGHKLVGTGNVGKSSQGQSVSLSGTGTTAVVGGGGDQSGLGAVWVFTRTGSTWTQQGSKLTATPASANANEGQSVALPTGAGLLLVGGSGNASGAGSAWIYNGPANLLISESQSAAFFAGQTNAVFTLAVTNVGGATNTGLVTVMETPPSGLTITSIAGSGWSCSLQSLTCTRSDSLAPGASYPAISIVATVSSGATGSITNSASVAGAGQGAPTNTVSPVIPVRTPGTVNQWGDTTHNQGTPPAGLTNVIATASGAYHSLALKADGTVVQWGDTSLGQGTPPSGLSNVVMVAAGGEHSLALKADGTVVQWGDTTHNQGAPPANLNNVVAIAAGGAFSLALNSSGTVVQWGDTTHNEGAPPSNTSTNVAAIAAGTNHSLALLSNGTVIQWGETTNGQGAPPSGLNGVSAIAAGGYFSLALLNSGTVTQWGDTSKNEGTPPAGLTSVVAIAAGGEHSLAIKTGGSVVQWGDTTHNQGTPPGTLSNVVAVSAGAANSLAVDPPTLTASVTASAGTPQSAVVGTAFTATLQALVSDTNSNPVSGATVVFTVQPGTGGAGAAFSSGATTQVQTNANGIATAPALTANQTLGAFTVTASVAGVSKSASFALTNISAVANVISTTSGTPQTIPVSGIFAPLKVTVTDTNSVPKSGLTVTFTVQAATNGAGAAFSSGQTATVQTASDGTASAPVLTANATSGAFTVSASVPGAGTAATFTLTTFTATASRMLQSAVVNTAFISPLTLTLTSGGAPLSGVSVSFSAPGSGASATFPSGSSSTTNANGIVQVSAKANQTAGSYTVTASSGGVAIPATFSLANVLATLTLTASGGTSQLTATGGAFPAPLQATVTSGGTPVAGLTITFTAPSSGASVILPSGGTAVTNASGVASLNPVANMTAGAYTVSAGVLGVSGTASYSLINSVSNAYITGQTPGAIRNDTTGWVGSDFTTGPLPVTVVALGRIYLTGNSGTHNLKLVNAATGVDVPGSTVSLTMVSGTANQYQYAALGNAVVLTANTTYYVVSQETAAGDGWYDFSPVTTSSGLTTNGGATQVLFAPYTTKLTAGSSFVAANFLYATPQPPMVTVTAPQANATVAGKTVSLQASATAGPGLTITGVQFAINGKSVGSQVSSPYQTTFDSTTFTDGPYTVTATATDSSGNTATSQGVSITIKNALTGTPFITGVTQAQAQNNFSGWVGMEFTVGSSPVTITGLGRYFIAGNTGTHTVKLANASTGVDVPGGSTQVTMTNPPLNQFVFGALPSPLTLQANTSYYLISQEVSGADSWYGYTPVTSTNVAVVNAPAYASGGAYYSVSLAGYAWVPVNFLYASATPPPTVAITTPASNATVMGANVSVTGTATPATGVTISTLQLYVDGNPVGSATASGGSFSGTFSSTGLTNGTHTLTAAATDSSGSKGTSPAVSITVQNASTAPTVSITTPAAGAKVSGTVSVTGTATPATGLTIKTVLLLVDGNAVGTTTVTNNSFSGSFSSAGLSNGAHNLTATATDSNGSSGTSLAVSITVQNTTPAPAVAITAPAANAMVSGNLITVTGTATPATGLTISSVQLLLDGNAVGTISVTGTSFSGTFSSIGSINGTHTLTAIATDSSGLKGTSPAVSVNVQNTTSPPVVAITLPLGGAIVSGTSVAVSGVATPSAGLTIASVQLYVDGNPLGTATVSGTTFAGSFSSLGLTNGAHNVTATATDSASVKATSPAVSVTVQNAVAGGTAFITGVTFGPTQNNFSGWVGLQFTVGSSPVTVTNLGRIFISGNTGTHIVKLANASTGVDVPGASVQVNVAAGTSNQFVYAALSNPVILAANTSYYLVSQEVSSGDLWYSYTPVTTTNVAVVNAPVYSTGGTGYTSLQLAGQAWVPVSFLYSTATTPPPTVTITTPTANASVSGGSVAVSGTATPAAGLTIASVQLYLDGNAVGTASPSGNSFTGAFSTAGIANGTHSLTASATDSMGSKGSSSAVSITVQNTPPAVAIMTPVANAMVSGSSVTVSGAATPGTGLTIASVQLSVDGTAIGTATVSGNSFNGAFNSVALTNGTHNLTATATDSIGNKTTSAGVSITVQNAAATPPAVAITAPISKAAVSGTSVTVTGTATPSSGLTIASVQLAVDGNPLGSTSVTGAAFSGSFDSTGLTNGTHTLTATATDSNGTKGTSSGVSITVQNTGPPTGTSFITNVTPAPLQNNYSGWVGMQFTTGSAPVTVKALGRIFITGNTGTHSVKLVNATTGLDVPGGSAQVNLAGGTSNQFVYAALTSPLTLPANTSYYLVSQEVANGDYWYSYTTVTSTNVGVVNSPAYQSGVYYTLNLIGYAWVPVSFLY